MRTSCYIIRDKDKLCRQGHERSSSSISSSGSSSGSSGGM